ncbi:hypothetical protein ACFWZ2_22755 [Streptomyces sp. NPDC059002]|uniref:hypothetical protein n=1 Tax=Streptomyces sp. NPDC059002 TaxID=3346690 RepID=UPI00367817B5
MRLSLITESPARPEFRKMIEKAARAVAPLVEEITGLSLPEAATIRLTSRHGFVADVSAEQRRGLHRDIAELTLSEEEAQGFHDLLMLREENLWRHWMLAGASTIVERRGNCEGPTILFMPDALYHQGAGECEVTMFVARELCHLAEHHAGDGLISRAHTMACPERRGILGYSHFVASGHGFWCARKVTRRLFGVQVGRELTGRESAEFTRYIHEELIPEQELRAKTAQEPLRSVWLPSRSATIGPPHELYEAGLAWVEAVVGFEGGRGQLNRVWSDLSLLPTIEEARDVTAWWKRITAQAPRAA